MKKLSAQEVVTVMSAELDLEKIAMNDLARHTAGVDEFMEDHKLITYEEPYVRFDIVKFHEIFGSFSKAELSGLLCYVHGVLSTNPDEVARTERCSP